FWEHFGPGLSIFLNIFVSNVDSFLAIVLRALTQVQGLGSTGFYSLLSATMTDLLGFEVDTGTMQTAMQSGARAANVGKFGAGFLNTLIGEFSPGMNQSITATETPASNLLGYIIEFSVRQGNIEFLTSLLPENFRMADGLRGYGANLAK